MIQARIRDIPTKAAAQSKHRTLVVVYVLYGDVSPKATSILHRKTKLRMSLQSALRLQMQFHVTAA